MLTHLQIEVPLHTLDVLASAQVQCKYDAMFSQTRTAQQDGGDETYSGCKGTVERSEWWLISLSMLAARSLGGEKCVGNTSAAL